MFTIVLLDDLNGVNYHRVMVPVENLMKQGFDNVHLVSDANELSQMDLTLVDNVVIPRCLPAKNHYMFRKIMKSYGIKIIVDIDDYWILNKDNFNYNIWKNYMSSMIQKTIKIADIVWTPSEVLAKHISRLNTKAEIVIVPNAIDPTAEQWALPKTESEFLRFGYTGAGAHNNDVDEIGYTFEDKILFELQYLVCQGTPLCQIVF